MAKFLIVLALIGAGIYFYQNQSQAGSGGTIKELLDRASSGPVSADEAKIAFTKAASELCSLNGADSANGFGTTDECLNRLHQEADQTCAALAISNPAKPFTSEAELKSAFSAYMQCAGRSLAK